MIYLHKCLDDLDAKDAEIERLMADCEQILGKTLGYPEHYVAAGIIELKAEVERWKRQHMEYAAVAAENAKRQDEEIDSLKAENERLRDVRMSADAVAFGAEIERLNQMLRDTGYGQGQIDAYAAQCEELSRLRLEVNSLRNQSRTEAEIAEIIDDAERLQAKIDRTLALTDTGTPEFREAFYDLGDHDDNENLIGRSVPGWRVVERIRETLLNP